MTTHCDRIWAAALALLLLLASWSALGHSGRTDGSRGHRDNKNKSGLGSYHYHCGGHKAHLPPDGYCPYDQPPREEEPEPTPEPTPRPEYECERNGGKHHLLHR